MATVTFNGATRIYDGADTPAVDDLHLSIEDGEFLVLVGPSGCGKSTTLRMLAGLEDVDGGRILIGDRDVTHLPAKSRDIAMVFQNYALYPHMKVRDNMAFSLKIAKRTASEIDERVRNAASMLDLVELLARTPAKLSGGQRQRVAMGRAIVREPSVFLMDEPLSNLDAKLRVQTRGEITALQRRVGVTIVYVTHDQTEAMSMADRVVVMHRGRIQQLGTPRELYEQPANVFVAEFIGSPAMNILRAQLDDGDVRVGGHVVTVDSPLADAAHRLGLAELLLGVRPEDLVLDGEAGELPVVINSVEVLGADAYAYGRIDGTDVPLVIRTEGRMAPSPATTVRVSVQAGRAHVFEPTEGQRIVPETRRA